MPGGTSNPVRSDVTFSDVAPTHPFYAEIHWMALSGITTGAVTWTPTAAGTYYFALLVTDPAGLSASSRITVSVLAAPPASGTQSGIGSTPTPGNSSDSSGTTTTPAAGACGGGGLLPLAVVPMLMLLMRGRRSA